MRARPGSVVLTISPVALFFKVKTGRYATSRGLSTSETPIFNGAETEWLPTLGESWQVPQVPEKEARFRSSLRPPTPVILIGFELNRAWPRAMLACRL